MKWALRIAGLLGLTLAKRWKSWTLKGGYGIQTGQTNALVLKRFLDEMKGTLTTNIWTDIYPISSQAQQRLG
jgi:hypothetical protein